MLWQRILKQIKLLIIIMLTDSSCVTTKSGKTIGLPGDNYKAEHENN